MYPGDPLRFHSHFLVVGLDWEEEFDLLDLIGGGRLGTGVKKGWLIGGVEGEGNDDDDDGGKRRVGGGGGGGAGGNGEENQERGFGGDGLLSNAGKVSESTKDAVQQNSTTKEPQVRTFCLEWGGM